MSLDYLKQALKESEHYESDVQDDSDSENTSYSLRPFELVSVPNDFNTKTMVDFIESDIYIPGFQRNYVWSIKRASRLIESAIVGLPIPQIFLYEKAKNKFLVIDGQQRMMSIYYFNKGRFPRKEKLHELRLKSNEPDGIREMPLLDDEYFVDFQLNLPESTTGKPNPLHRLKYKDLDDETKSAFNIRTIRNVIVRQIQPEGYNSMYEIFNRLNSGGMNLTPQEIRWSIFGSKFYNMLYDANTWLGWRRLVGTVHPDIHMKDIEILLRGFAMLINMESYSPPLARFLDKFSHTAMSFDESRVNHLRQLFDSFLSNNKDLPNEAFFSVAGRFSPMIFESVFVIACTEAYSKGGIVKTINPELLKKLKNDPQFNVAAQSRTTSTAHVKIRFERSSVMLMGDDG